MTARKGRRLREVGVESWAPLGVLALLFVLGSPGFASTPVVPAILTQHAPILIEGDNNFTAPNGVTAGTGGAADPYVIEGWLIDATSSNGITIRQTRAHLLIRNLTIEANFPNYWGIYFDFASNATVENVSTRGKAGVYIWSSSNIALQDSAIDGQTGVALYSSSHITIKGNRIGKEEGINAYAGDAVRISGNDISYAGRGILFDGANNTIIDNNTITWSGTYGLLVVASSSNLSLADNDISSNGWVGASFEGGPHPAVRRNVVVGEGEVGGRSDDEQPVRPTPRDGVVIDDRVVRSVEQDSSVRIRNVVPLNLDGVSGVGVDAFSLADAVALDRDERRRIERHSRLAVDGAVLDRDVRGRPNVHAGLAAGRNVLDGRIRCKVKEDAPVVERIRLDREVSNHQMGASLSDGDAIGRRRIDEPTLDDIRVGGASRAGGDSVRRGEIVVSLDEDGRMLSQNRGRDRRRGESGRAEDEEERKDPERSPGLHPYLPESPPLPRRHPPNSSWVQAVFHDSLRLACQLRPHERYVPAVFIVLVPGAFAGVSGVVPSRRGRTGNRGGPSERGSSFSYPPSAGPSLVRESNRRTDRERALHDPWFSWSSTAISFPAPTSSDACLSEEWQSPDFTTSCVPQSYERSKTQNTGTCQETCRICVSCHGAGR